MNYSASHFLLLKTTKYTGSKRKRDLVLAIAVRFAKVWGRMNDNFRLLGRLTLTLCGTTNKAICSRERVSALAH